MKFYQSEVICFKALAVKSLLNSDLLYVSKIKYYIFVL
jgi:hypothetical protein